MPQDTIITDYFSRCVYKSNKFGPNLDLKRLANNGHVKILVTGGLFYIEPYGPLMRGHVMAQGFSPDTLLNFDREDSSREYAIAGGCVPIRCRKLYQKSEEWGIEASIYVDCRSLVLRPEISKDVRQKKLFLLNSTLVSDQERYVVYSLVERDSLF